MELVEASKDLSQLPTIDKQALRRKELEKDTEITRLMKLCDKFNI